MPNDDQREAPEGWIGGFAESDPRFAYPTPDLGCLPMLDNLANIDLLQRQLAIPWPEFSWETEPGNKDPKRCFQMFAPDISRIGYTDAGRVYSIICPQQGIETPSLGSINVEITVTGQRGWVDETTRELACDMSVEAKVWFAPGAQEKPAFKVLWKLLDDLGHDLPISKATALVVSAHEPGDPSQPIFQLWKGETTRFEPPAFARHPEVAFSVGHIEVEIGPIVPTRHTEIDELNQMILDILNLVSGNMLKQGNVLTWNLWLQHPEVVHQPEWRDHAETWRRSIDVDHVSAARERTPPRYHDGTVFHAGDALVDAEVDKIYDFLTKQLSPRRRLARTANSAARRLHLPFRW
jgi:hypothetical protein